MAEFQIRKIDKPDLPVVEALAKDIWPHAYKEILSSEQITYMLDKIYSQESLIKQVDEKRHTFYLLESDHKPVGFASYSETGNPGIFKLHKIYVSAALQGMGLGKFLLDYIVGEMKTANGQTLELNVNRYNKARWFYEKLGFEIIREEDIDIGQGYFMNDYVMRKPI